MVYICDDCGYRADEAFFQPAKKLSMRLTPGGIYTELECSKCGALAFPAPRFAYTAIVDKRGCSIGRADEGIQGYTPMSGLVFKTYDEADDHADAMNKELGLDNEEAIKIVASTMRGPVERS